MFENSKPWNDRLGDLQVEIYSSRRFMIYASAFV